MILRQKGEYKSKIFTSLYKSTDLKKVLLDNYELDEKTKCTKDFKEHCKSHLFVDGTLSDCGSYIFFDVVIPNMRTQTKTVQILMYVVAHRDILDEAVALDGVTGNRADVLAMLVEDALTNPETAKQFGIGDLTCEEALIYNGKDYYGTQLTFTAVDFK